MANKMGSIMTALHDQTDQWSSLGRLRALLGEKQATSLAQNGETSKNVCKKINIGHLARSIQLIVDNVADNFICV